MDRQFTYINEVITPSQAIKFQTMGVEQQFCLYYWKAFVNADEIMAFGLFESRLEGEAPQFLAADSVLTEWMSKGFDPVQETGIYVAAFSTAQVLHLLGAGMWLFEVVEGGFKVPENDRVFRYYEMAEAAGELARYLMERGVLSLDRVNQALRIYSKDCNQLIESVCGA